ncbi:tetratricopeptide repeat protein [Polyangium jinanense]|uniref:Tetratricopeptide repeat protein n=1 Tax=Polyangium jinanense TaxID=2829994 RepID=A0A9X4AU74_9BACT|nr:hypothetical protein [Polyangium jinanense]MDC3957561.1 hypothetical protein [Polyangium jinanense]MDC3984949.1 hypothetical protein [Polyangium jinanense]
MIRRSMPLVAASLLGLSFLVASPAASAQAKKPAPSTPAAKKKPPNKNDPKLVEAKRLFQQGEDLYTKGDYEKAIEVWEMSYELSQRELILESIANAYERLGKAEKAREYLGRWREGAPPEEHADLDARLAKLDERIAKEKAEKDAKEKADQDAKDKHEAEERAKREGGKLFMPGVILAAAGGAVAIGGGVLDILAATRRPDASVVCGKTADGRQLCRSSAQDDIESSNTFATVGDIMLIGGGVAAVVGVVLVVTQSGGKKGAEEKKTAVAPWFLPGGGGIVAGGSF